MDLTVIKDWHRIYYLEKTEELVADINDMNSVLYDRSCSH